MKNLVLISSFTIASITCFSQKVRLDSIRYCSDVMTEISYYWKLDSNANNGFRFYTYRMLIDAKIDKIDKAILLSKLGKPNEIRESNNNIDYRYYYFDIDKMPKDYDAPIACWYLSFKFKIGDDYLSSIEEGDLDR